MTSGSGKDFKVPNKMSLQFVHDMTRGYVLCFVLCMSDRNLLNATRAGIASFCKKYYHQGDGLPNTPRIV